MKKSRDRSEMTRGTLYPLTSKQTERKKTKRKNWGKMPKADRKQITDLATKGSIERQIKAIGEQEQKSFRSFHETQREKCKEKYEIAVYLYENPRAWTKFCRSEVWNYGNGPTLDERAVALQFVLKAAAGKSKRARKNASKQWAAMKRFWIERTPPSELVAAIKAGGGIAKLAKANVGIEVASGAASGRAGLPNRAEAFDTIVIRKALTNGAVNVGDDLQVETTIVSVGRKEITAKIKFLTLAE